MSTLNFNVGVLGHVDSGKTSLAKALSTVASTACFDKNPQSKQRGITLDLGFSSFTIQSNEILKEKGYDYVQYTLVDCPGHASLIKTIIGGAQIIDMMLLVIDITKGVQTQTAECLIIGEICCDKMLVVLNKLDLVEEAKRDATIEKMSKRLSKTLEGTKFANSRIIAVAANKPSTDEKDETEVRTKLENMSLEIAKSTGMLNMDLLIDTIKEVTFFPERKDKDGALLFSVDHCFGIKGQGTVMTGTILNGNVKINDTVEIPHLKVQTKVKSIQVFRKPVEKAFQGDRCGICISNFDSKQFERGIVSSLNYVKTCYGVIIKLNRIKYYKSTISSGSKYHISMGHETILGKIELFAQVDETQQGNFNFSQEYTHVDEINEEIQNKCIYAFIDFNYENSSTASGVLCVLDSLLIGSRLDTDIHLNQCRIAFYGHVIHMFTSKDYKEQLTTNKTTPQLNLYLTSLKVYKNKHKEGIVERRHDEFTLIGKSLFKKETNIDLFVGMKVSLSTGESGYIEASFGQSGKFKVRLQGEISQAAKEYLDATTGKGKKKQDSAETDTINQTGPIKIFLDFKRFIYDDKRKMAQ